VVQLRFDDRLLRHAPGRDEIRRRPMASATALQAGGLLGRTTRLPSATPIKILPLFARGGGDAGWLERGCPCRVLGRGGALESDGVERPGGVPANSRRLRPSTSRSLGPTGRYVSRWASGRLAGAISGLWRPSRDPGDGMSPRVSSGAAPGGGSRSAWWRHSSC
jgi:hypothetical protein